MLSTQTFCNTSGQRKHFAQINLSSCHSQSLIIFIVKILELEPEWRVSYAEVKSYLKESLELMITNLRLVALTFYLSCFNELSETLLLSVLMDRKCWLHPVPIKQTWRKLFTYFTPGLQIGLRYFKANHR